MVAEHHDQRLVGGVIQVGGAAGFGQPHDDLLFVDLDPGYCRGVLSHHVHDGVVRAGS